MGLEHVLGKREKRNRVQTYSNMSVRGLLRSSATFFKWHSQLCGLTEKRSEPSAQESSKIQKPHCFGA